LLWKVLFNTVGLRSHIPYEAALLVAHVGAVFLLFGLIRRRSGDAPAFGAALLLLVLGSGADNIVWAASVGFVGAVAFGLLAMLLIEGDPPLRSRIAPVSLALLCSLMCSSAGLAFLVAVGAQVLVDRRRRRFLLALIVPTAAFVLWFLAFDTGRPGYGGIQGDFLQGVLGWGYIASLLGFVVTGLAASAAGVAGAVGIVGVAVALAIGVLVAWDLSKKVEPWQVGLIAAIVFFFTLVATGRVQYGTSLATQTRYVYVGVVLLLPLVAHSVRRIPWRGLWRPAVLAMFGLFVLGNLVRLHDESLSLVDYMRIQQVELQTVEFFRGAPDLAVNNYIDNTVVSSMYVNVYFASIDELGSPVPRATIATLQRGPLFAVDRVMLNLFGDAVTLRADSSRSFAGMSCRDVDSTAGSTLDLKVPSGETVMLQSTKGGEALLFLGFEAPPPKEPLQHVQIPTATPGWLHVPDTGKPVVWQLRITTGAIGLVRICTPS
jgi:hypothetical protein